MANCKETIRQVCIAPGIFKVIDNNILNMNYIGICRTTYPEWEGWLLIDLKIENIKLDSLNKNNWKTIGKYLKTSEVINNYVIDYYKNKFWSILLLDDIIGQGMANMIFHSVIAHGLISTKKLILKLTNQKIYNEKVIQNLNKQYIKSGYLFYIDYFKLKISRYLKIYNRYEKLSKKLFNIVEIDLKILNQTLDIINLNKYIDITDISNLNELINEEKELSIKNDISILLKLMSSI